MTIRRPPLIAALALTIALGGIASAQGVTPASESDPGDTQTVKVTFGGFTYELFADEPVQACVISHEDGQAGASLAYRLFVRESDGSFSSVGLYPTPAIGALTNAQYGDCTTLEAVSDAG